MERGNELKERTRCFALNVITFCRTLPATSEARRLGDQLFRAATAVAANYRAVCRARSRADFIAKLGVVIEEADESKLWLDLLTQTKIAPPDRTQEMPNPNLIHLTGTKCHGEG